MALQEYRRKRKFEATPEPRGKGRAGRGNRFVVQEHHATRLHYDFRLEVNGVLKSWAVPKGPSLDPSDKRLAVQTEDHPLEYAKFEGTIPAGNYGAGEVIVWDEGTYEPEGSEPADKQIERGELKFILYGQKLKGSFVLVKLRWSRSGKPGKDWLLIKHRDAAAEAGWSVNEDSESVVSGRSIHRREKDSPAGIRTPAKQAAPRKVEFPDGAKKAAMPEHVIPALATLAEKAFSDPDWLFEIKWDGVRTLARVKDQQLKLWSRSRREITREYPEMAVLPNYVNGHDVWLDGEIVALDKDGRSDFQALQQRFSVQKPSAELLWKVPVVYYVFDILYCDGYDLRKAPLIERKKLLKRILDTDSLVRYSDHEVEKGQELYELARERRLEGIIGKQMRGAYPEGRTKSWLKFKFDQELDAVVGGWTDPRKSREHFGALLVGLYEGKKLEFIAGVGTGFSVSLQASLAERLRALQISDRPFAEEPDTRETAHWVKPELVARVTYGGWTDTRHLRQPRFAGLLEDHDPRDCTFEKEMRIEKDMKAKPGEGHKHSKSTARGYAHHSSGAALTEAELAKELHSGSREDVFAEVGGQTLHFTNLNKVYFPQDEYTKRDLLSYYLQMAQFILPFLKDRALVLRRYPNGIEGDAFFQKDAGKDVPDWIQTAAIRSETKGSKIHYFLANDLPSLLYLTNLGCIDHNPWSSRYDDQEHPDYIFFDLDPSAGAGFASVVKLARALTERVEQLGMKAFVKTSGATGLHIFIPIQPRYAYEQVRQFVELVATWTARDYPELITTERSLSKRPERSIYVDAHQNSRGQSLASVYSVRAFPHAPVSAPVSMRELNAKLRADTWNIKSMPARMKKAGDLWARFWKERQEMESAVEKLAKKL
ncbi:MAG TPA: DNA ligase D [Candidatus Acidoferrales bacterium]|jgi:bifunctional non-homologous end joining protein LigD|nr:DNA ligase D [Candidatus Acidoferrales bacterium]